MTGIPFGYKETVLGWRKDDKPSVTVHWSVGMGYACFDNPRQLRDLMADLEVALTHLESA